MATEAETPAVTEAAATDTRSPVERALAAVTDIDARSAPEPEPEAPQEDPPKPEEKGPEKPLEEPALEAASPQLAAIARREKKQREAHEVRMTELKAKEAELTAAQERIEAFEAAKKRAMHDPVGFYKTLGVEKGYADIARELYAAELGDDAPKELKERSVTRRLEQQIDELRREREEEKRARTEEQRQSRERAAMSQYQGQLLDYSKAIPETLPHLRVLAKDDPQSVADTLFRLAVQVAKDASPGDTPPTAAKLAEMYEASLRKEFARFGEIYVSKTPQDPKLTTPAVAEELKSASPRTLTNASTATRTTPRPPALTEDERVARAVQVLESMGR